MQRKIKIRFDKPIFTILSITYNIITRTAVLAIIVLILAIHIFADISISKSGAFIGALGLLLSLKHNFLKIASNQDEAVKKSQRMSFNFFWEGVCETELFKLQAAKETTDELLGILLVIAGGLISSYGDDLTILLGNLSFDRQLVFEFTGFLSLIISCCLFLFSIPAVRTMSGTYKPHEQREQEQFVQEYAKQMANRLLGKYLFVFGLVILMLASFI